MISIEEFCAKHCDYSYLLEWALNNCTDMLDAWNKLEPEWLVWVASRPGVLSYKEMCFYAVFCASQVENLLNDRRSKCAIAVAEQFANGKVTENELIAAQAAAKNASFAVAYDGTPETNARFAANCVTRIHDIDNICSTIEKTTEAACLAVQFQARKEAKTALSSESINAQLRGDAGKALDKAQLKAKKAFYRKLADWLRKNTKPNFERQTC